MISLFNDVPVFHNQNHIRLLDRRETVGHNKTGAPLHHGGKGFFLNISDLDSYFVAPSGDTIPETCLDGYVACMMVDPKDGRDMIFVDRNMLIDSLHIRGEASYMGSRIDVMYVGIDKSSDAVRIINDTVVFKAYLIIMDTDISSVINLKVLKDRDTTRLWVEDISDQIVMGDD